MTASFYPKQEPSREPESRAGSTVTKNRLPDGARVRRAARVLILILLAGWGAVALARDLVGLVAAPTRGHGFGEEPAPIALARCEGSLAEARGQANRDPSDGAASLRVASLELRRAELMALVSCEARHGPDWSQLWKAPPDTVRWRERFLRADPQGCLTRATEAARAAARQERQPDRQRQALELLATARAALGDARGEADALAQATRHAPERAALWLRLADAYGRAGQFVRADSARTRGLALMDDKAPRHE